VTTSTPPSRQQLEARLEKLRRLADVATPLRIAPAPVADPAEQTLPDVADTPPADIEELVVELPAVRCGNCPYFGAVTVQGPIRYPAGAKGECRLNPPDVPCDRHLLAGEAEDLTGVRVVEMTYRLVAAARHGCGYHPDFSTAPPVMPSTRRPAVPDPNVVNL
jgi:hypothetical protein